MVYEPAEGAATPFIIRKALGLGHPFGYVTAMMRRHSFEELAATDAATLAAIEAAERPTPRRAAGRTRELLASRSQATAAPVEIVDEPSVDRLEPACVVDRVPEASGQPRDRVELSVRSASRGRPPGQRVATGPGRPRNHAITSSWTGTRVVLNTSPVTESRPVATTDRACTSRPTLVRSTITGASYDCGEAE